MPEHNGLAWILWCVARSFVYLAQKIAGGPRRIREFTRQETAQSRQSHCMFSPCPPRTGNSKPAIAHAKPEITIHQGPLDEKAPEIMGQYPQVALRGCK